MRADRLPEARLQEVVLAADRAAVVVVADLAVAPVAAVALAWAAEWVAV